jgi:U3 small nucleolar RNA-associated protein 10
VRKSQRSWANCELEIKRFQGRQHVELTKRSSAEKEDSDRAYRRTTSLLNFATELSTQLIGKSVEQPLVKTIVRELVIIFGVVQTAPVKHSDVPLCTLRCLGESMKLLSAENFLGVVRELADSDDQQVS